MQFLKIDTKSKKKILLKYNLKKLMRNFQLCDIDFFSLWNRKFVNFLFSFHINFSFSLSFSFLPTPKNIHCSALEKTLTCRICEKFLYSVYYTQHDRECWERKMHFSLSFIFPTCTELCKLLGIDREKEIFFSPTQIEHDLLCVLFEKFHNSVSFYITPFF